MKKLIIICLLAFTYTSTQAQEPTKQETMDWIAGKMKEIKSDEVKNFSFEKNIVSFTYYHEYLKINSKYVIYLDKISGYSLDDDSRNFQGILIYLLQGRGCVFEVNLENNSTQYLDQYELRGGGFDLINNKNLKERFKKALDVLIKYNTSKSPNEKF